MSSSLRYRSSSAGGGRSSPVDWDHFDTELARVDPCFANPKFDSLKHVLTVLSSSNAEAEVEELREQRAAVEDLVEQVVEGYHAGFNRAIHNYSGILRLFAESRLQLESLRRSLEAAARRLGTQSRGLVAQYTRDLALTDTLRLLGDIQACVEVPARVARLEESKEWPMAVSLLLDGCNKLARQELQTVGALRELAADMGRRRAALLAGLVAEMEARAYRLDSSPGLPPGSAAAAAAAAAGDPGALLGGEGGGAGGPAVPRLALPPGGGAPRGSSSQEREFSSAAGNLSGRGLPPRPPGGAGMLPRTASFGRQPGDALAPMASLPRRAVHRRAQTLGGLMPAAAGLTAVDGHLVDAELPQSTLVDCVAQLGGLHEAQAALRRHMPAALRRVVSRALDTFPSDLRLTPQDLLQQQQQQQRQPAGAADEEVSVAPAVAAAAQALLEHVLGCCMQVFQQVTRLLHMLSSARVPKASSGLELLLRQAALQRQLLASGGGGSAAAAAAPPSGPPGPEAMRAEVSAAWECLQAECQSLLADILGVAPPAQRAQRGGDDGGDVPLAGWLAAVGSEHAGGAAPPPASPTAAGTGMLSFSLAHEVQGLLSAAGEAASGGGEAAVARRGGADEVADVRQRIRAILGGAPGSPALVAALYRPTLQFAEAADRHVASLTAGGQPAEPRGVAALLAMPWRGAGDSSAAERSLLRGYVESFLRMEFLPAVYVSARARCSAALEDGEAFKPRSRLRAPYQPGAGAEGRPILPAALATERMVEELLGWAAQVPPFATHLTGVVENVLGRVLDAFESQAALVARGSAAGKLAESLPVVQLMAREPSAALLGSPVAFFVGRNTEAMESFVSSVIAAGFGANDEAVEADILQQLMAGQRSVPPTALLAGGGDVARLASLAALSDSLDFIAEVIHRCTAPGGPEQGRQAATGGPGGGGPGVLLGRREERQSSEGSGGSGAATLLAEASQQQLAGGSAAAAAAAAAALPSWQQQLGSRFRTWRKAGSEPGGLTEGLAHLADRYRALAGQCARVMRLDLLLLVLHHLQQLPRSSYVCTSEEEAREVDECVAALARLVGRLEEGLEPYLPPHKRAYCFGSLASAAARFAIWLLPDIREWNHLGVTRMCHMLASLQPALAGVAGGGGGGGARPDAARQFDRAKLYYTLLTYSAEGLVATVAEKPHRFTLAEYTALLSASVAERPVAPEQRAALQKVLADAGRAAKPAGKANAALLQGAIAKAVKAVTKQ